MAYDQTISLDIDLHKVLKENLNKGQYLKLTLIRTPNSPHHEYMVKQYNGKGLDSHKVGDADDMQTIMDKIAEKNGNNFNNSVSLSLSNQLSIGMPFST